MIFGTGTGTMEPAELEPSQEVTVPLSSSSTFVQFHFSANGSTSANALLSRRADQASR
jgi:hypothetical protein